MINNPDIGAIAYTRLLGIPKRAENTFCALKASLKSTNGDNKNSKKQDQNINNRH